MPSRAATRAAGVALDALMAEASAVVAGTQGQGYTDNCVSFRFAVYGPGTQCWKSGGNGRVKSTNWFHSQSKRRRGVEGEGSEECSPQFFSYPDADGTYHQISVSSASEAEIIADHYAAENFTALTKFKRHLI
ncbi:hypothetical protein MMC24_004966 [Lignoscripta atroalba]|nr:hypothetical protein [Lignoscripta atroalba]